MGQGFTALGLGALLTTSTAFAAGVTLQPTIWYELNSGGTDNVLSYPSVMRAGQVGVLQARAYLEWDVSNLWTQFLVIDSATLTISNVGRTLNSNVHSLPGNGSVEPFEDWFSDQKPNVTWVHQPIYGWDDPFQRGPLNTLDITNGLRTGQANAFGFFGVMIAGTTPQVFAEILPSAALRISGTAAPPSVIPLPAAGGLLLSSLAGLGYLERRR